MKTKIFLLLALCAVVTLSFTFASAKKATVQEKSTSSVEAPAGGFSSEDKF
jgi:hypothetical protein